MNPESIQQDEIDNNDGTQYSHAMNKKMVIIKNGNAVFVDVETGVRKEGAVEVTKGLQAGDTVVVSGVLFAKPNAPVQIRSVKQLKDVVE